MNVRRDTVSMIASICITIWMLSRWNARVEDTFRNPAANSIALIVRDHHGRGLCRAGGTVGALRCDRIDSASAISETVRSQIQSEVAGDYPVAIRIDGFIATHPRDVAGCRCTSSRSRRVHPYRNHLMVGRPE